MANFTIEQQKLINTLRERAPRSPERLAYLGPQEYTVGDETVEILKENNIISDFHRHSDGRQRFNVTSVGVGYPVQGDGSRF